MSSPIKELPLHFHTPILTIDGKPMRKRWESLTVPADEHVTLQLRGGDPRGELEGEWDKWIAHLSKTLSVMMTENTELCQLDKLIEISETLSGFIDGVRVIPEGYYAVITGPLTSRMKLWVNYDAVNQSQTEWSHHFLMMMAGSSTFRHFTINGIDQRYVKSLSRQEALDMLFYNYLGTNPQANGFWVAVQPELIAEFDGEFWKMDAALRTYAKCRHKRIDDLTGREAAVLWGSKVVGRPSYSDVYVDDLTLTVRHKKQGV